MRDKERNQGEERKGLSTARIDTNQKKRDIKSRATEREEERSSERMKGREKMKGRGKVIGREEMRGRERMRGREGERR